MITCGRCGRDNQEHYKFCLGCGSEVSSQVRAPAPPAPSAPAVAPAAPSFGLGKTPAPPAGRTPSRGSAMPMAPKAFERAPTPRPPAAVAAAAAPMQSLGPSAVPRHAPAPTPPPVASGTRACPSCGAAVPAGFAFCGGCGAKVAAADDAPAAAAVSKTAFFGGPAAAPAPVGRLVLIRPDGSEGGTHSLQDGENLIGRGAGALFDADAYLSPRHAMITFGPAGALVEDLGSLNGVFVKVTQEEEIQSGEIFRLGQELMRFEAFSPPLASDDGTEIAGGPNPGYWGRLSVVVAIGLDGATYPLLQPDVVMGRERGEIVFADDGYVSGAHCRVSSRAGHFYLADIGSSNGTFLRIYEARIVARGRFLLMGQQLFRLEY